MSKRNTLIYIPVNLKKPMWLCRRINVSMWEIPCESGELGRAFPPNRDAAAAAAAFSFLRDWATFYTRHGPATAGRAFLIHTGLHFKFCVVLCQMEEVQW
jgi:hypothetical protein